MTLITPWSLRFSHRRSPRPSDGDAVEVKGIGFAGVRGFRGGFGRGTLGSWGEKTVKAFVQEAVDEALKLESALAQLRTVSRVAVMHYAPIQATVENEPPEILPFLGCGRLEDPLNRYPVTAVVDGHAHNGSPEGRTAAGVPVFNVSLPFNASHSFWHLAVACSGIARHPVGPLNGFAGFRQGDETAELPVRRAMIWVVLPLAATGPRPGRTPVPALNWLSTDIIILRNAITSRKRAESSDVCPGDPSTTLCPRPTPFSAKKSLVRSSWCRSTKVDKIKCSE